MYVKPTTPRSIGGIVDDGIRLYRDAFAQSWPLALTGQVCFLIPAMFLQYKFRGAFSSNNPQAALEIMKSPLIWLLYLVGLIVFLGFYNAVILQLGGIAGTEPVSRGRAIAVGFRLLPRTFLLVVVMFAAFFVVAFAVGIVLGILGGILTAVVGSTLVPLVLGVLGVALGGLILYVWGKVYLAHIALLVENAAVFKSLGISWSVITGQWWRSAAVYSVAFILVLVFYLLVAAINGSLAGLTLRNPFGPGTVIAQLVSFLGGTLLMTFIPAVLLALYYDLKLRKEGTDLAGRVNALASQ